MKKTLLILTAVAGIALGCHAQDKIGDIVKSGDQYFIYLTELASPEANMQFQKNLAIVKEQNAQVKQLQDELKAQTNPDSKAYGTAVLQKLERKYKENEKLMGKAYGFAPNRTYRQLYYKSNLCIILTKDEIAQLKMQDGTAIDPQKISNLTQFAMYRVKEVSGPKENEQLQIKMGQYFQKQAAVEKARKALSAAKDPIEQKKLNDQIVAGEKQVKEIDAQIRKEYGLPEGRSYAVEVSNSRLYMLLTPQEVEQLKASAAKNAQKK